VEIIYQIVAYFIKGGIVSVLYGMFKNFKGPINNPRGFFYSSFSYPNQGQDCSIVWVNIGTEAKIRRGKVCSLI
jgi:hypothetical protein